MKTKYGYQLYECVAADDKRKEAKGTHMILFLLQGDDEQRLWKDSNVIINSINAKHHTAAKRIWCS